MKITMYELFRMLKDNKAPEKIRIFDGTVFKYYEPSRHYYTKDKDSLLKILDEYRGDVFDTEVEILEEKKLPEKIPEVVFLSTHEHKWTEEEKVIVRIINEIIDYSQYLKSKGDE